MAKKEKQQTDKKNKQKNKKVKKPEYYQVKEECDCGNSFEIGSTRDRDIKVEICSACHPLYTGKKKLVDSTGRVKRFKQMMEKSQKIQKDKKEKSKQKKKTDKKTKNKEKKTKKKDS